MMDELYHYGVKGMKWGRRKDDWNKNYNQKQRHRDRRVYGKSRVRRINKEMNKYGESLSGARSYEADRINSTRRSARIAGQIGRPIGALAAGFGTYIGVPAAQRLLDRHGMTSLATFIGQPESRMLLSAGMTAVGGTLGRYGAQSATMLARGYSPSKFR